MTPFTLFIDKNRGGLLSRGIFGSLLKHKGYTDSSKDWVVELLRTDMYWYELIVNGNDNVDTKKKIFGQMKELKDQVESNLEKRFVYFICSRKKVRFCPVILPEFLPAIGKYKITVLLGKDNISKEIFIDAFYEKTGFLLTVEIEETGKFIYFCHENGDKTMFSVHDFLLEYDVNLGIETVVQYVGYTKNPNSRPLNGVHGGLNEILYKVSNDDNDILFFFNLFKVLTIAKNNELNVNFTVANSMIDEVKVDKEGFVIEKCFIFYFDSINQTKNKMKEKKEIENDLLFFANNHKINSVSMCFEVDSESEYYKFSSSKVKGKNRHVFTTKLENNLLVIEDGSIMFDEDFE